ncbi:unnamed protein product [Lymnaea stagnalis]|uniref:EF-hand domain-containing protein n=1 Tax=Lymnaea stagnalis TaxID=6523 RepID=A0AAV2HG65_LYMST
MGGSSSKSRKSTCGSKYELNQELEASTNSCIVDKKGKGKKESVKRKKKNSVKIKTDKKTLKKQASFHCDASQNVDPSVISGLCKTGPSSQTPSSPIYRKKSSCTSCEARDILCGKNRSRSGSDKSLRFSDFNKILRKTRVYDWEMSPLEIPLDGVPEPSADDVCYVCGVYTGCHVRICRVCLKAYHDGCLLKIGHPLTEKDRRLIACKQWSCHQCVALNHLLTQEEVGEIMDSLEDYDISKDHITEASYLLYCKQSQIHESKVFTAEKEASSVARFHMVAKSGIISWIDFLNMESVRILNRRNKDSLVHLLTQAEISEARRAFKLLDKKGLGLISKADVQAYFDSNKSRVSAYYPDQSMIYIDEDLDSPITWREFLRDRSIYFLGQRPNLMKVPRKKQPSGNSGELSPSLDSIDDDDDYSTCQSDLDSMDIVEGRSDLKQTAKQSLGTLNDSLDKPTPLPSGSPSMLEDFNTEMDKCCSRHEIRVSSADPNVGTPILGLDITTLVLPNMDETVINTNTVPKDCAPSGHAKSALSTQDNVCNDKSPQSKLCKDSHQEIGLRSSPYNDSRHQTIPWEDLGNKSGQKCPEQINRHRKSEVITRSRALTTPGQARAVSQVGCRTGKNLMAPAYGNLVGRVNSGDWGY